jgi:hypothetical protein
MKPSGLYHIVANQQHPNLPENKTDSKSVMCKENLSQQSHFYVERQMHHVTLLTILSNKLRNSHTKFERIYCLRNTVEVA